MIRKVRYSAVAPSRKQNTSLNRFQLAPESALRESSANSVQPQHEPVEPEQRKQPAAPASTQQAKDELNWSELAYALELDSVARQVVLNSIVDSYADHRLQLAFLAELEVMLKPDLERQIKQAIEHKLGVSLSLELHSVPSLEVETPHQASLRKLEQQRQSMIQVYP